MTENSLESIDLDKPLYSPSMVMMPVFRDGAFTVWPHEPFFEIKDDGSAVMGYKPCNYKLEVSLA